MTEIAKHHARLASAWEITNKARSTVKAVKFQLEEVEKRLGTNNEKPEDRITARDLAHKWKNEASKAAYPI